MKVIFIMTGLWEIYLILKTIAVAIVVTTTNINILNPVLVNRQSSNFLHIAFIQVSSFSSEGEVRWISFHTLLFNLVVHHLPKKFH